MTRDWQAPLDLGWAADVPPYALTDRNVAALERAIRAEGYNILVDPATGAVRLEKTDR